jgi:hypothetical protein
MGVCSVSNFHIVIFVKPISSFPFLPFVDSLHFQLVLTEVSNESNRRQLLVPILERTRGRFGDGVFRYPARKFRVRFHDDHHLAAVLAARPIVLELQQQSRGGDHSARLFEAPKHYARHTLKPAV